jgi:hypothetical protein
MKDHLRLFFERNDLLSCTQDQRTFASACKMKHINVPYSGTSFTPIHVPPVQNLGEIEMN